MGATTLVVCAHKVLIREENQSLRISLSWSNFLKIVDEAEKHGVESISLHGGGEPTLNKYFIPFIKYIKKEVFNARH